MAKVLKFKIFSCEIYFVSILYPLLIKKASHLCEALFLLVAGTGPEPVTFV